MSFAGKELGTARRFFAYYLATGEVTVIEGVEDDRSILYAVDVVYKTRQGRLTLEHCEKELEVYRNRFTGEWELAEKLEDARVASQFGVP